MKLSRIKSALLITPLIVVAGLSMPAIAAAQSAVQIDQTCNADREGKCAKATPVTFEDPTCGQLGSYTIPSSEGVDYTIAQKIVQPGTVTVPNGTTVTITADPQQGYFFEEGAVTTWAYTFNVPKNCEVVATPTVVVPQVTTTPTGGVSAGAGGVSNVGKIAAIGLIGSISLLGLGVVRKFNS